MMRIFLIGGAVLLLASSKVEIKNPTWPEVGLIVGLAFAFVWLLKVVGDE